MMKPNTVPSTLLSIGMDFAKQTDVYCERRLTMALCLPRVEFASTFLCLGFLKEKLECENPDSGEGMMDSMVGEWVEYTTKAGEPEIGTLERSDIDESYRIALYKQKLPDFSKMAAAAIKKYKPPTSAGLWTPLERTDWHRVRLVSKEFNPERSVNRGFWNVRPHFCHSEDGQIIKMVPPPSGWAVLRFRESEKG